MTVAHGFAATYNAGCDCELCCRARCKRDINRRSEERRRDHAIERVRAMFGPEAGIGAAQREFTEPGHARRGTDRFAFAPLEHHIVMRSSLLTATRCMRDPLATSVIVRQELGITVRHVYRLRRAGLSGAQADRFAVRAGFHPGEIWPDWWLPATIDERRAS